MLYKNSFYQMVTVNVWRVRITKKHAIPMELRALFWSCLLDLNQRPLPYQGSALPLSYRGVADSGFEPLKHEATDLQSVPFDRLGNPPCCLFG